MGRSVLVYDPDLLFSSRVESACVKSGLDVRVVVTMTALTFALKGSTPEVLIVNLDALGEDGKTLVGSVHAKCRLVGYYSHADSKLAADALASGFSVAVPRRAFADTLKEIIADVRSS